jgi:hypothetical protein
MMVNGDCSSGTGWTLPAGSAIAAGKMTLTAFTSTVNNSGVTIDTLIDGATYRNAFTIDSRVGGSVQIYLGETGGTIRSSVGTFSEDMVYVFNDDNWILFGATSATMQLDNFSVKSVGLNGIEANWTLTANWNSTFQCIQFGGIAGETGSLTGAAATAFDAAVSNNTACTFTALISQYNSGTVEVSFKGGAWVDMEITTDGEFTKTVTSGTGSGFSVRSTAGAELLFSVAPDSIALA